MTLTTAEIVAWVSSFMWPFVRFSAMLLAAPVFGSGNVPLRVRIVLALFLALMIAPTVPAPDVDLLSPAAFLLLVQQVLAGVLLGVVLRAVFAAVLIAGQTVANAMGLGFASMVDPQNGVQVPVLGQFYMIMATLIFLAVDGHLVMVRLLAESFQVLPLSTQIIDMGAFWSVVVWCGEMFFSGLLISLPVVAGVLLANLALGIVTRAAPQLNIFAVGFPMTILVGFVLLLLVLPAMEPVLEALFERGFSFMALMLTP